MGIVLRAALFVLALAILIIVLPDEAISIVLAKAFDMLIARLFGRRPVIPKAEAEELSPLDIG